MFQLEKRHQIIILIIAAVILFGAGYKYSQLKQAGSLADNALVTGQEEAKTAFSEGKSQKEPAEIVVHVAGEVKNPGVYRLAPGARVIDAINLAGPTEDSALDSLNLAALLEDGKQITVFSIKELQQQQAAGQHLSPATTQSYTAAANSAGYAGTGGSLININLAGQAQLEELPGIGPALAQRIIDYRSQNGPFAAVEDIMNVSGIGEKRFEQIKSQICVK